MANLKTIYNQITDWRDENGLKEQYPEISLSVEINDKRGLRPELSCYLYKNKPYEEESVFGYGETVSQLIRSLEERAFPEKKLKAEDINLPDSL